MLLNLLSSEWHSNEAVTILDIMNLDSGLSESTLHRRIGTLLSKGIVILEQSAIDGRSKVIKPTQLTLDYFSKLSTGLNTL